MAAITCNNKGCFKVTYDSLYSEEEKEIVCSACGKTVTNISQFTKNAFKNMGLVLKSVSTSAFSALCTKCGRNGQPLLNKDWKPICHHCKNEMNLTPQFVKMLKDHLKRTEAEAKETA